MRISRTGVSRGVLAVLAIAGAKDEEVVLQLIGYGPSETNRLREQEKLYRRSK